MKTIEFTKYLLILGLLMSCSETSPFVELPEKTKCYKQKGHKYPMYGKLIIDNDGYGVQYTIGDNRIYGNPHEVSMVFYSEIKCPNKMTVHQAQDQFMIDLLTKLLRKIK